MPVSPNACFHIQNIKASVAQKGFKNNLQSTSYPSKGKQILKGKLDQNI